MVKGVKGRLYGDRVYYTVTVGDDPLLTKRGVTQIFADMQMATARLNDVIAPAAPRGLELTSGVIDLIQTPDGATRATVTAQWIPSPEDDFSHYSVEYGYDPLFVEVQRANISQTSDSQSASTGIKANVVHTFQADSGRTLYYRVCAVDVTNNRSQWVEDEVVLPSDETPCSAPESLNVSSGFKANTLSWSFDFYDPNYPNLNKNNTDFSRFRIYRRAHDVGSYAAVAETSATQYIDTNFANYDTGYNYAVTSLDRTGNESGTPGTGGAAGVEYNANNNIPSQITGSIDIADATIIAANIGSLDATVINTGVLDATSVLIRDLDAAAIRAGDIELSGNTVNPDPQSLSRISFRNPDGNVYSYWDRDGLVVKSPIDDTKRVYIHNGKIDLINSSGVTTGALDGNGINATSITVGQLPGGSNAIPNSSFELAGFGLPIVDPVYGTEQASPLPQYKDSISAGAAISPANASVAVSGAITAIALVAPVGPALGSVTYTCSPHSFAVGDYVTISGVITTVASVNLSRQKITAVSGTTSFTIQPTAFPTGAVYTPTVGVSNTGKAYRDQIDQTSYGW